MSEDYSYQFQSSRIPTSPYIDMGLYQKRDSYQESSRYASDQIIRSSLDHKNLLQEKDSFRKTSPNHAASPSSQKTARPIGEDDKMFSLLSSPIDNKVLVEFYKKNYRKDQLKSDEHFDLVQDNARTALIQEVHQKMSKNKGITILVEQLRLLMQKHFTDLTCQSQSNQHRKPFASVSESLRDRKRTEKEGENFQDLTIQTNFNSKYESQNGVTPQFSQNNYRYSESPLLKHHKGQDDSISAAQNQSEEILKNDEVISTQESPVPTFGEVPQKYFFQGEFGKPPHIHTLLEKISKNNPFQKEKPFLNDSVSSNLFNSPTTKVEIPHLKMSGDQFSPFSNIYIEEQKSPVNFSDVYNNKKTYYPISENKLTSLIRIERIFTFAMRRKIRVGFEKLNQRVSEFGTARSITSADYPFTPTKSMERDTRSPQFQMHDYDELLSKQKGDQSSTKASNSQYRDNTPRDYLTSRKISQEDEYFRNNFAKSGFHTPDSKRETRNENKSRVFERNGKLFSEEDERPFQQNEHNQESFEQSLERKIENNLDDKLRKKLHDELLKLLSQGMNSLKGTTILSSDQGSQTESERKSQQEYQIRNSNNFESMNYHQNTEQPKLSHPATNLRKDISSESAYITPSFYQQLNFPVNTFEKNRKISEEITGFKDYSAISHREEYPSFSNESPIRNNTRVIDNSQLLHADFKSMNTNSPGRQVLSDHSLHYSHDGTLIPSRFMTPEKSSETQKISRKAESLGKVLEKLYEGKIRFALFKIHRHYLTKRFNIISASKQQTLNYLVFAKKVEKLYRTKLRSAFTQLCFKSQGSTTKKKFDLGTFFKKVENKIKKRAFGKIRTFAYKSSIVQKSFRNVFSILNQRKMKNLSEAFFYLASFSLVRREEVANLNIIVKQLSEIQKSRVRSAFIQIKNHSQKITQRGLSKTSSLKYLIKERNLKRRFMLKQAFQKWNSATKNISANLQHKATLVESRQVLRSRLLLNFKNIFNSRQLIQKCFAFSMLKHHTKNLNGALILYSLLNRKLWSRMRVGFDNLKALRSKTESPTKKGIKRIIAIHHRRLQKAFNAIQIHSRTREAPKIDTNIKEGIMRLCIFAEDLKQNFLFLGLKMIELNNIHARNKKSLYTNLALKLYLLIEEKQRIQKKNALNTILLRLDHQALQQRLLEKILKNSNRRNLSFYFNKFKNEMINYKLNYSMIHLAIKDIVIAVEKLNKIQRSRKALAFGKLSSFLWEKPHLSKENFFSNISTLLDRNALTKNNSIDSIDFSSKSPDIRASDQELPHKITLLSECLETYSFAQKFFAFSKIKSESRISRIADVFEAYGIKMLKKLLYKRLFYGFAQIKYRHEKTIQKLQHQKVTALSQLFETIENITFEQKSEAFMIWKDENENYLQGVEEKIQELSRLNLSRCFNKWRACYEERMQKKDQVEIAFYKVEQVFNHISRKIWFSAFQTLKGKKPILKIPLLEQLSSSEDVLENIPQSNVASRVKTSPSKEFKSNSNQNSSRSAATTTNKNKSSNRPQIPSANQEQSAKKPTNRPQFGATTGISTPSTNSNKLSRAGSLNVNAGKRSFTMKPSQPSGKTLLPSQTFKTKK